MSQKLKKTNYPEFSVAMCVYKGDNPQWFDTSLHSIIYQTVMPSEIVLVIDGDIPDTIQSVVDKYIEILGDKFIVIKLEENQGHGTARRCGLKHCSYNFIALMDADDISAPKRFELQLQKFVEDPSLDIVGGNIEEFIGEPTNIIGKRIVPTEDSEIKKYMKKRCPMNQMTVMFKRDSVENVGSYMDWYCNEDYYLWVRMAMVNMKFANIDKPLVQVRVGEEMYRRRGSWKYFKSEAKLQGYMLKNGIIRVPTYIVNLMKRLIVQVLLPNRIRGWVFKTFARS